VGKDMKANNVCPFIDSEKQLCSYTKKLCNKKFAKWRDTSAFSKVAKKFIRPLLNKVAERKLLPGTRLAIGSGIVLDFYPTCKLFMKLYTKEGVKLCQKDK